MDLERIARWYREFVAEDAEHEPLYSALCNGIADDPELVGIVATAQPGQWRPNLLLAAVHDIVLRRPDDELARWYPTVGGTYDGSDPMPAFRSFLERHAAEIERIVASCTTQTNEVNRSCLWFVALRAAAADVTDRPIALVEVGASAGLNLRFDSYAYDLGDGVERGTAGSPVALVCDVRGTAPLDAPLPPIVSRVGLDANPIDLADPDERRWLKACIWPEQSVRHARFDAAADLAVLDPPRLVADDAVDGIAELVEDAPPDAHVVIVNSWVMTYLARDRRVAFDRVVDELATGRTITRISAEAETVEDWYPLPGPSGPTPQTLVAMARWRDGERTDARVAHCHPHLRWLQWFGQPRRLP